MDSSQVLPIESQTWTDDQRRAVWCLIVKSRRGLKVELSPIIASAFVILQHYFKNQTQSSYDLFTLMVAALFAACKAGNCFRPMEIIYKELSRILKLAPQNMVSNISSDTKNISDNLDADDFIEISNAEIDLLHSINFETNLELPFAYFEKWRTNLMMKIPNEAFMNFCTKIIIDICLVICSKFYLDLPPEVAAAAATADTIPADIMTDELNEWFKDVRQKYGKNVFDLAMKSIREEKNRTAQPTVRKKKIRLIDEDEE